MPRVAVIGAGISGLVAAYRLQQHFAAAGRPAEVTLYEQSDAVGGCIRTLHEDGVTLELGPDSLLVEKKPAADLLQALGLQSHVIDVRPECAGAQIVEGGKLRPLPSGFRLFSPASITALLRSGIFSWRGLARAAMEPFIPPRRSAADESVASFVTRRFGREVLDRLAQPLIGGIYSGDPQRLGMESTLPQFLELERRHGSIIRGMQRARGAASAPRLASLREGVAAITDALRKRITNIQTETQVCALHREQGEWVLSFAGQEPARADAVISAVPAYVTAQLLRGEDSMLADELAQIRYNSIAVVNLVYAPAAHIALPRATGFVVPFVERRRITAASFTSQKYESRAPDGTTVLRAFLGGALQPQQLELSESELALVAQTELAELCGIRDIPRRTVVTKWMRLLPEYAVDHLRRTQEIRARAQALGSLSLAGSAYAGVGIPDCIQAGEAAAESAFGYIGV